MSHDDLDYIPSIVATRDGQPASGESRVRANKGEGSRPAAPQQSGGGGTGALAWLLIAISLLVALAVGWWAWQLQAQLSEANGQIADYAERIGDLEARLSDTDEGMNQNAQLQAVKIKELESEVRKLWDNVWKDASARLEKLEAASASQDKSVKGVQGTLTGTQSQLKSATGDIAGLKADIADLKKIESDLERLITSAKTNQAEVERVADNLNQINLALAKLERRVVSNEEWVASINTFRKQVNTSLSQIQTAIRAQSTPQ